MAAFKDEAGREWRVAIDAPAILRVREECDPKFLLNDTDDDNTYNRMQSDPVLLCRVIYTLCASQLEKHRVNEAEFYAGVIGNAIDEATQAVLEAILSFTPRRTRELLEVFARKQDKLQQVLTLKALDKLNDQSLEERVIAAAEAQMDALFASHLTPRASATGSPALSEST